MRSRLKNRLDHIIRKYENEQDNPEMKIEYMPLNDKFVPFEDGLLTKPSYSKVKVFKLKFTPGMDQ